MLTEDELEREQTIARNFAAGITTTAMTKMHNATALVAMAMAFALIVDRLDLADGVTVDDMLKDFSDAVKDCLSDMHEATKEKH